MSYNTLFIAFDRDLSVSERFNRLAQVKKIPGVNITDTTYMSAKDGYQTPSRYICSPKEGCMAGGQFVGGDRDYRDAVAKIRKIPGVAKIVGSV